jgi:hypothetical protein
MTEFDLEALEKALGSKGRKPRQGLSLKQPRSKQELYEEAKRLAKEYDDVYSKYLYTRHKGDSYWIMHGELRRDRYYRVDDIDKVPIQVFEQLVANGRRRLKDYHEMLNRVIQENPEIALEANLEGKTNSELLRFAYRKRLDQIDEVITRRVKTPQVAMYLSFNIWLEPPLGQHFTISVNWWSYRVRSVTVSGVELYPKKPNEMAKLVHFLTYFEQVIEQVNQQLDEIEIKKEVAK